MLNIRTPESQFHNLPEFPFNPNYFFYSDQRVHYIDEGPKDSSETILCLHGEPTWSFMYRKLINPLAKKWRVLALDFIGFGRSDKLLNQADYSFRLHLSTLEYFLQKLALSNISLIVHDWGGLIGLTAAALNPERFSRLIILNTGLPIGEEPLPEALLRWQEFVARIGTRLPIGRVIKGGLAHPERVPAEVFNAYEAPFPSHEYKAGAAVWPLLIPASPTAPGAAEMKFARQQLARWRKPALVIFSDSDPMTEKGDKFFRTLMPSAREQPEIVIRDAGHFLVEEKAAEIFEHIVAFIQRTGKNSRELYLNTNIND